ncbi:MAG: LysR substrate-binding domain-containing protein [Pseudomonadota bacterium]
MDRFEMMRCFVAVADHASFAAAARKLGLSTSALTRHVAGLEDDLSTRLLRRTTRAVSLTDEGARFLDHARRLIAGFEEARSALEGSTAAPRGHLVVAAPVVFGRLHLGPLLGAYALQHADLTVELLLSDRNERIVESGIDAAIRIGNLEDSSDVAVRIGSVRRVLVGAPGYIAASPPLVAPTDLRAHRLIEFKALAPRGRWMFRDRAKAMPIDLTPAFSTDSAEIALDHARRSGGLTLALSYQVAEHIRDGTLVRLLPAFEPPALPLNFVVRERRFMPAKVRRLLEKIRCEADWEFL